MVNERSGKWSGAGRKWGERERSGEQGVKNGRSVSGTGAVVHRSGDIAAARWS